MLTINQYAPFNRKQVAYIQRTQTAWLNVAEGGKRGGKNVVNALAFCIALENHPNKLHLVAGYDISSAKLNILDCDGYGVINYFSGRCREGKYKNRECLYINTQDGQQKIILLAGGGKANSYKAIKGNTYGMVYITEANECHPDFLKECEDRTLSSQDRKIFHDLNPKAPNHWYYKNLEWHEQQQRENPEYGYNYGKFNIFDNMSITDDALERVLATYDKTSIWYKRDILGNRIANEGFLFKPIINDEQRYLIDQHRGTGYITTGIDFGGNGSAHAFVTVMLARDYSRVTILKSDRTEITDDMHVKMIQLQQAFRKHIHQVVQRYGRIDTIYCDSAEQILISALQQEMDQMQYHIPIANSRKTPISGRIRAWNILLMNDRIKFIKGEAATAVAALQGAVQDPKEADDRYLDDGTSDIDTLDAMNYAMESWYRQLIQAGGRENYER